MPISLRRTAESFQYFKEPWDDTEFEYLPKERVYHVSDRPYRTFIHAPLLHVGYEETSRYMKHSLEKGYRSNPLQFADHVEVHPNVFTDWTANAAQKVMLQRHGFSVPTKTAISSSNRRNIPDWESEEVDEAVEALGANKTIAYQNDVEVPKWIHPGSYSRLSLLVPSPAFNLMHVNARKPLPTPLPNDWVGVHESDHTKHIRKMQRRHRNTSTKVTDDGWTISEVPWDEK
jgi:hypothetical protein